MAIVNYCIMAIIQVRDKRDMNEPLSTNDAISKYDFCAKEAFELMEKKNHDYGAAWLDMRVSSITDLILTKICVLFVF